MERHETQKEIDDREDYFDYPVVSWLSIQIIVYCLTFWIVAIGAVIYLAT